MERRGGEEESWQAVAGATAVSQTGVAQQRGGRWDIPEASLGEIAVRLGARIVDGERSRSGKEMVARLNADVSGHRGSVVGNVVG